MSVLAEMNPPSVTHIITGLEVGGAERALHALLTCGLEGPFRNCVISLMGPGHYGPLLEAAGIPITCLHMRSRQPTLEGFIALRTAIINSAADLVQGWMAHGNLSALFAHRLCGRRTSLAWNIRRSLDSERDQPLLARLITQLGVSLSIAPDAIIYNSSRSRDQHETLGYAADCAHVIPNGFNTVAWRPDPADRYAIRQELGLSENDRVIGFVGRGHVEKDIPNLFAAVTMAVASHPEAVLICVGRDLDRFEYRPPRIILMGQQTDVARIMRAFDVLCLSSRAEGFPNVLGEAMASGVPCVTTDVGDACTIVGETGWIAPARHPVALGRALELALDAPPAELQRRGKAARARIEQRFSIETVVCRYVTLYRKLLLGTT